MKMNLTDILEKSQLYAGFNHSIRDMGSNRKLSRAEHDPLFRVYLHFEQAVAMWQKVGINFLNARIYVNQ